jgi:enoyl-CoA hydratase
MATESVVLTEVQDRIAVLTINRPERRNALNGAVREAFVNTLARWADDTEVHVVIVTGAGEKSFVAGADIAEFADRTPAEQLAVGRRLPIFQAAEDFPKPIIAAVNGYCLGGGCELALACDIRIASEDARFGQPEVNLGIMPGGGGTQRLARLIGLGATYRMLYTGKMIGAAEASRLGLVDEVVPAGGALTRARELAATITKKSPLALRLIKEAVRASVRTGLDEGLRYEASLLSIAFSSSDKQEGVRAFLEKREARFTGQ